MIKNVCVCDNCERVINTKNHFWIDFKTSRFIDAAGDTDYNEIRVDLCESCCMKAVEALKSIARKIDGRGNERNET